MPRAGPHGSGLLGLSQRIKLEELGRSTSVELKHDVPRLIYTFHTIRLRGTEPAILWGRERRVCLSSGEKPPFSVLCRRMTKSRETHGRPVARTHSPMTDRHPVGPTATQPSTHGIPFLAGVWPLDPFPSSPLRSGLSLPSLLLSRSFLPSLPSPFFLFFFRFLSCVQCSSFCSFFSQYFGSLWV